MYRAQPWELPPSLEWIYTSNEELNTMNDIIYLIAAVFVLLALAVAGPMWLYFKHHRANASANASAKPSANANKKPRHG